MVRILKAAVTTALLVAPMAQALQAESCLLVPSQSIELSSPVPGVVSRSELERGAQVTEGQILVRLDDRQDRATIALAQARMDFADRRIERNQTMLSQNLLADQEADELQTERALAELELKQAQSVASLKVIRSPITGWVLRVDRHKGEYVGTDPLAELIALDPLKAELVFPARVLNQISVGDSVTLNIQFSDQPVSAIIDAIDPLVDPSSGTFGARATFANPAGAIRAGLRCELAKAG